MLDLWMLTPGSMSLESAIEPSDSEISLKSGIRGLSGARIYSRIQNPQRWVYVRNPKLFLGEIAWLDAMLNNPARPFTNLANCIILGAFSNCSNDIFHKNSTYGRNWDTKTLWCLVSCAAGQANQYVPHIDWFISEKGMYAEPKNSCEGDYVVSEIVWMQPCA